MRFSMIVNTNSRINHMPVLKKMTAERVHEFALTWNTNDAGLVASYFTEDGVYCASVGPDRLGKEFIGREAVRAGVESFFERFPGGRFENIDVTVRDDIGYYEWDFVMRDEHGDIVSSTAGCDLLVFRGDMLLRKNAFRKIRI
jgi:SnoaL-like domain